MVYAKCALAPLSNTLTRFVLPCTFGACIFASFVITWWICQLFWHTCDEFNAISWCLHYHICKILRWRKGTIKTWPLFVGRDYAQMCYMDKCVPDASTRKTRATSHTWVVLISTSRLCWKNALLIFVWYVSSDENKRNGQAFYSGLSH